MKLANVATAFSSSDEIRELELRISAVNTSLIDLNNAVNVRILQLEFESQQLVRFYCKARLLLLILCETVRVCASIYVYAVA